MATTWEQAAYLATKSELNQALRLSALHATPPLNLWRFSSETAK